MPSSNTVEANSLELKLQRKQRFNAVFGSPVGREVLTDILKMSNAFDTEGVVDNNPYMTYLHEGQRRLALSIAREVFEDDRYLLEMIKMMDDRLNT